MWCSVWPAQLSRHAGKPDSQHTDASAGGSSAQRWCCQAQCLACPRMDALCSLWLVIIRCSSWLWHNCCILGTVLCRGNWAALGPGGSINMAVSDFINFVDSDVGLPQQTLSCWCGLPTSVWPNGIFSIFKEKRKLQCKLSLDSELHLGSLILSITVTIYLELWKVVGIIQNGMLAEAQPFFMLCCCTVSPNQVADSKPCLNFWKFSPEIRFYSFDPILTSGISLQACGCERIEIWMPTAEPWICFWLIPSSGPLSAAVFLLTLSRCKFISAEFCFYPEASLWQKCWLF